MGNFQRHVFSGSRVIFWGVVPIALLLTVLLNLSMDAWTPFKIAVIGSFDASVLLLSLGLYHPVRFRWALRLLTGIVFGAALISAISSLISRRNVVEAFLGLLVIGGPALIYTLKGRFSLRPRFDDSFPIALANSRDDSVLREALNAVLGEAATPGLAGSVSALTAAEVIAAMRGAPADLLPQSLRAWPSQHAHLCTAELVDLARRAIARVASQSALQAAWQSQGQALVFQQKIRDLQANLQPPPG